MAQIQDIATEFVTFYYTTFDSNRQGLASLYRDQSMLTFESSSTQGIKPIMEKLTKVQHRISTLDAQPSNEAGGIIVMVTGVLVIDDGDNPMSYSQVFQLMPNGENSYFVYNDVFKLIFG